MVRRQRSRWMMSIWGRVESVKRSDVEEAALAVDDVDMG
jgi:hypothetical protein